MANPAKKLFVKLEKKLAIDLEPGDIFILDLPDPEWVKRELNRTDVALVVMMRTNVSADDIEDRETVAYKLHIETSITPDHAETLARRVDPHTPPGLVKFK